MPLEAVNKIAFSDYVFRMKVKDLILLFEVKYDTGSGDYVRGLQEKILRFEDLGGRRIAGALPDVLFRFEQSDPDFARKIVVLFTGYSFIPAEGLKLTVEFDTSVASDSPPVFCSSLRTMILPGMAYGGNFETLKEKLQQCLDQVRV